MLEQGYGILPNKILFDDNLSSSAKLLFVYISSLCAVEGYCWATNKHFAQRLGLSESQIKKLLASLKPYLRIENGSNQKRRIFLSSPVAQKRAGSQLKNELHNNTKGIKKNTKKKIGTGFARRFAGSGYAVATQPSPAASARTPEALGLPDLAGDFYDEYYAERRWR